MATKTQVVFDCADPDRLARFWAEALHYKLQDPPAGFASWEAALRAWKVPEEEWNSASAIVDPEGRGPRIYFQRMDTPKPGKNRLHLDLNASNGTTVPFETRKAQVDSEVERLLKIGATKQRAWDEPPRSKAEPGEYWSSCRTPRATNSASSDRLPATQYRSRSIRQWAQRNPEMLTEPAPLATSSPPPMLRGRPTAEGEASGPNHLAVPNNW